MNLFRDRLRRIVETVEGAQAVSIVGLDGIPVESFIAAQGISIEEVAAEMGAFIRRIEGPGAGTDAGRIGELVVVAERAVTLLSRITPEYYLLLLLSGEGNLGRGRWELKKAALTLRGELL